MKEHRIEFGAFFYITDFGQGDILYYILYNAVPPRSSSTSPVHLSPTAKKATKKSLGKWQCHRCKEVTNTPKAATVGTPNSQRQYNQGSITVSTA